jgi:D-beta-D-heptose 7-phosphate kinase/D-beta-D-heptose 1-phosphate adenosyltransferase
MDEEWTAMRPDKTTPPLHAARGGQLPARPGGFSGARVLVVGDIMMDCYALGEVHRISPEAPVPVVALRERRWNVGGAANVAMNVAGLLGSAIVAGVVGDDSAGQRLAGDLRSAGIDAAGLVVDASRPTTCKTRVMSGSHQIVRLDEEVTNELEEACARELLERIVSILDTVPDAVILSDYAKGVFSDATLAAIVAECRGRGIPVLVDPKKSDYMRYAGATCITPNFHEFRDALLALGIPRGSLLESGARLREVLGSPLLLVTQGADGMTLFRENDEALHLPALSQEVFDVSGAGDTVIATLATSLAAGDDVEDAMLLANVAASIVVTKVGTVPVAWMDLQGALENHHLMAAPDSPVSGTLK